MVAGLQAAWAQKVVLYKTGGQTIEHVVSELDSIVFVEQEKEVEMAVLNIQEDTDDAADVLLLCSDGSYVLCDGKNDEGYGVIYMNASIDSDFENGISIFLDEDGIPLMASTSEGHFLFKDVTENSYDFAYINNEDNEDDISYYYDIELDGQSGSSPSTRKRSIWGPYIDAWRTLRSDGHWQWDEHNKKALVPFLYKIAAFGITACDAVWGTGQIALAQTLISEFYKSSNYTNEDLDDFFFGHGLITIGLSGIHLEELLYKDNLVFTPGELGLSALAAYLNNYGDRELEKLGRYNNWVDPVYYNREEWKINVDTNVLEFQAEDEWKSVFVNSKALWDIDESFINHNWCEVRKLDKQVAVHVTHNESVEERGCYLKIYAKTSSAIAPVIVTIKQAGILTGNTLCPDDHHPHAIDLGLPSGTKWCCCNVGASSPEGYGGYYAWGETNEKNVYWLDTYAYYDNTGYIDIGSDIAGTCYDAATVNMGAPWRMPSHDQQMELIEKCSKKWTTQNGINGILVTGPNGSQIFLPAAGDRWFDGLDNAGSHGYYWSSNDGPCNLNFDSSCVAIGYFNRIDGQSIRAVRP